MESKIFEDVKMFKDLKMTEEWSQTFYWSTYKVEVVGTKARITTNSPMVSKEDATSRLNKLKPVGKGTKNYYYGIIVNGKKCFFKIPHNIFG